MDHASRHYSDEEIALILKRAIAAQRRLGTGSVSDGLSLETVRELASEIGLTPALIDEAAASLDAGRSSAPSWLLGGPVKRHVQDRYPVRLDSDRTQEALDILRRELATQGETHDVMGGVEWQGTRGLNTLVASIAPRGDGTTVHVSGDATEVAIVIGVAVPVLSLAVSGIVMKAIHPGAGVELLTVMGGFVGGLAIARGLWARASAKLGRQVEGLRQALAREIQREAN